jgi:hypothetical protein
MKHPNYKVLKNEAFSSISGMPGVCSSITLHGLFEDSLRKLSKSDLQLLIIKYLEEKPVRIVSTVKTVQISLNVSRWWSLFTPWRFAYSYRGHNDKIVSVFYINFD